MIPAIRPRPLLVVCGAQACAIAVYNNEWVIGVFCFLLVLLCRPKWQLVVLGLSLGLASAWFDPGWLEPGPGTHELEARVVASGFSKGRYTLDLAKLKLDGQAVRGRARVSVKRSVTLVEPGARLELKFVATTIRPSLSSFDYRRHLRSQGIRLLGQCRSGSDIRVIAPGRTPAVVAKAQASLHPLARPEAEILLAALLGIDGELTNACKDAFNSLGICHLIVISGYNFALVMLFGYTLAYLVGSAVSLLWSAFDTELLARCVGLVCVGLYWLIVTPGAPTTRSGIMATVLIIGLIAGRRLDALNVLALAAVLILARWPLALFTPSFLLSFGAVFGLLAWMPGMRSCSRSVQYLLVTLVAGVYTLPVIVHVFGFAAPLTLVWNLLLVPFYSFFVMPLGYAWLLANCLIPSWAPWFLHLSLWGISQTLGLAGDWGNLMALIRPSIYFSLACALGLLLMPLVQSRRPLLLVLAPLLILSGICGLGRWQGVNLRLSLLPNGNNAVVVAEKAGATVVYGSGSMGFARYELAPYLLKQGVRKIDLLIMPRPVGSEAGGIPYLIQHFEVGQVWVNVAEHRGSVFDDVIQIAKMRSTPIRVVTLRDGIKFNSLIIEVLNPSIAAMNNLEPDLQTIAINLMDGETQVMIVPKLNPRIQASLAFRARSGSRFLIQTTNQMLAVESQASRSADFVVGGSPELSYGNSWFDKDWLSFDCFPDKLRVKSKPWKADGYQKEGLRLLGDRRGTYE